MVQIIFDENQLLKLLTSTCINRFCPKVLGNYIC